MSIDTSESTELTDEELDGVTAGLNGSGAAGAVRRYLVAKASAKALVDIDEGQNLLLTGQVNAQGSKDVTGGPTAPGFTTSRATSSATSSALG